MTRERPGGGLRGGAPGDRAHQPTCPRGLKVGGERGGQFSGRAPASGAAGRQQRGQDTDPAWGSARRDPRAVRPRAPRCRRQRSASPGRPPDQGPRRPRSWRCCCCCWPAGRAPAEVSRPRPPAPAAPAAPGRALRSLSSRDSLSPRPRALQPGRRCLRPPGACSWRLGAQQAGDSLRRGNLAGLPRGPRVTGVNRAGIEVLSL